MKVYIVEEARNFTGDFYIESLHRTKAIAEKHCRDDGFKWCKEQELFLTDTDCRQLTLMEME